MSIDPAFEAELNKHPHDSSALEQLFQPDEIQRLNQSRCGIDPSRRNVVYAVFENPFARGGGIYAVAKYLPPALARVNHRVVIVSPFHSRLAGAPETPGEFVANIKVSFAGGEVDATVYRLEADDNTWLLIDTLDFFNAAGDTPYNQPNESLLRDGLFAAAAIPRVLKVPGVDLTDDVVVHIQDWQLAATALTVKEAILAGDLNTAAVVLTSHNPYDYGLTEDQLGWITWRTMLDQWQRPIVPSDPPTVDSPRERRATMYECMMPLTDAPLSTVSRQYAHDLTTYPLHTMHFANHLQEVFRRQGLVGVNNGLFMTPHRPFSESAEREAKAGRGDAILGEKLAKRRVMLEALTEFRPAQCIGSLQCDGSSDLTKLADNVPVFMMFGRMDPGQKGFDLLAHAIQNLRPGLAKFAICPIIPPDVEPFVEQWHDVTNARPGDVVVYTGRMQKYFETMAGVSFCVMPSLHEPFGAATEPYLQGTPVVAHETGGLIQQVVNYRDQPGQATGVLFHHTFQSGPEERGEQWQAIMTEFEPNARLQSPLYVSLVNALTAALELAAEIYRNRSLDYAKMLANLFDRSVQFSWDKAAAEYNCIYDCVSRES